MGFAIRGGVEEGGIKAGKEAEAVRPVASVRLKEEGIGGGGDGAEAKVRIKEGFADEVRAVGEGGSSGGIRVGEVGDDGGIVEVEEGSGVAVNSVSDARGSSGCDTHMVAAVVVKGGAEVKGTNPVLGPRRSGRGPNVGDTQLASRVDGVGREIVTGGVKAFPGG